MGGQPGRGLQLRLQGLAVFIWASPTKISFGQAWLPRTGVTTAEALFIRNNVKGVPTEEGAAWRGVTVQQLGLVRGGRPLEVGQDGWFMFPHLLLLCKSSSAFKRQ